MSDLTRRDVLKQAGGVLAASVASPLAIDATALAAVQAAPAPALNPLMTTLSTY